MKPFNLEEAKAGKPVCTRDGDKVKIISFNYNGDNILAIVNQHKDGKDYMYIYTSNGCLRDGVQSYVDLRMTYIPKLLELAYNLALLGCTDNEIKKGLGITKITKNMKVQIDKGRIIADKQIAEKLKNIAINSISETWLKKR